MLGELGSLVGQLSPGEDCVVTRTVQMRSTSNFHFTVTGSSAAGGNIQEESNELSVLVTPEAAEIQLSVRATADRTRLQGPGKVTFSLVVDNECMLELRNVSLSEINQGEVRQLIFVPSGEMPPITQEYEVRESSMFQFMAQVQDSVGDQVTVYSEPITIRVYESEEIAPDEPTSTADAQQGIAIPVPGGDAYHLDTDAKSFRTLIISTALLLLAVLTVWYIVASIQRGRERRRARKRRKQQKIRRKAAEKRKSDHAKNQ